MEKLISQTSIMTLYGHYKHAPISPVERLFVYLRLRLSSYQVMEKHVPTSGQIVDLGCGFGMLTVYLALLSQARQVRGVDISHRRLRAAQFASAHIHNVAFEYSDLLQYTFDRCNCILLIDTLHYFPVPDQNRLLKKCYERIGPGGRLLLRDSNKDKKFRHFVTRFHETIMTRSGFTKGEMLCFRSFAELTNYLEGLGFFVDALPMWHRTPFADTLLVCTKSQTTNDSPSR
ncbi:MAG: class I SAM-dependent methyltransferase [Deltaproteobacteria bacterium]|nr:class I SAM-dependent methyltransferase [Deltaproteobacteria bacterium]